MIVFFKTDNRIYITFWLLRAKGLQRVLEKKIVPFLSFHLYLFNGSGMREQEGKV